MRAAVVVFTSALLFSSQVSAIGFEAGGGDGFQYLNAGFGGPGKTGFTLRAGLLHNDNVGSASGPVLGVALPFGPLVLMPGTRLSYLKPDGGKTAILPRRGRPLRSNLAGNPRSSVSTGIRQMSCLTGLKGTAKPPLGYGMLFSLPCL